MLMILSISMFAQTASSDEKDSKLKEIESVISLNPTQKSSIQHSLLNKRAQRSALSHEASKHAQDKKEMAFKKYAIDKKCHEELIQSLSEKQIAEYCNIVFAPEVDAKTKYKLSLLTEEENNYTEAEISSMYQEIYKYLMLEKIVYFTYKYDYAKQKNNISRLKAIQPTCLKASNNIEKQKGYGKFVSGKVKWNGK
jgi:predicted neuraminidase